MHSKYGLAFSVCKQNLLSFEDTVDPVYSERVGAAKSVY
jgi:hypothetical protein